jgi:hypothetical protein
VSGNKLKAIDHRPVIRVSPMPLELPVCLYL